LNRATQTKILWWAIGVFALYTCASDIPGLIPPGLSAITFTILLLAVAVLHCTISYRTRDFVAFFLITFIVSNIAENLSILTGVPFGHYYYSDILGAKLFLVPLIIAPAYFAVGYLSWTLARVLLGAFEYRPQGWNVFLVPLVATFVMVSWDVSMDPTTSTIDRSWIWLQGGGYFGVPFSNFVPGWFLTVYIFLQIFALYLYRFSNAPVESRVIEPKAFWYQAAIAYGAIALGIVIPAFVGENVQVADPTGTTWMTGDIHNSMALVTIFTMVFIVVLSAITIAREERIPARTKDANGRSGGGEASSGCTAGEGRR
jgi:putative membrane protein